MLNKITLEEKYPITHISSIINGLAEKRYFTVIDLKDGYMQIKIREEDRYKTAFRVGHKVFEWTRLPMGFCNSPLIFQRIMDTVLDKEISKKCFVYLDVIVIFGENKIEHDKNLEEVLNKLQAANLCINQEKWNFRKEVIEFLGFEIRYNQYRVMDEKIKKVDFLKAPTSKRELMSLLGFINYFRKFLENGATLTYPLTKLLRKNQKFEWSERQEIALKKIKEKLNEAIILNIPDVTKPFILYTDASNYGLGAILMQEKNGKEMVIEFASRSITKAKSSYGITEKEALGMIWGIEYFRNYLRGSKFIVKTDHKALVFLDKERYNNARIRRWVYKL